MKRMKPKAVLFLPVPLLFTKCSLPSSDFNLTIQNMDDQNKNSDLLPPAVEVVKSTKGPTSDEESKGEPLSDIVATLRTEVENQAKMIDSLRKTMAIYELERIHNHNSVSFLQAELHRLARHVENHHMEAHFEALRREVSSELGYLRSAMSQSIQGGHGGVSCFNMSPINQGRQGGVSYFNVSQSNQGGQGGVSYFNVSQSNQRGQGVSCFNAYTSSSDIQRDTAIFRLTQELYHSRNVLWEQVTELRAEIHHIHGQLRNQRAEMQHKLTERLNKDMNLEKLMDTCQAQEQLLSLDISEIQTKLEAVQISQNKACQKTDDETQSGTQTKGNMPETKERVNACARRK